jgi:hypothetical protein
MGHAAFGGFLLLRSEPLQRQCFLYLSICLITVFGNKKVHIVKVGKAVRTTLVNCNLPALVRKDEKATILLSHFETRGRQSQISERQRFFRTTQGA